MVSQSRGWRRGRSARIVEVSDLHRRVADAVRRRLLEGALERTALAERRRVVSDGDLGQGTVNARGSRPELGAAGRATQTRQGRGPNQCCPLRTAPVPQVERRHSEGTICTEASVGPSERRR